MLMKLRRQLALLSLATQRRYLARRLSDPRDIVVPVALGLYNTASMIAAEKIPSGGRELEAHFLARLLSGDLHGLLDDVQQAQRVLSLRQRHRLAMAIAMLDANQGHALLSAFDPKNNSERLARAALAIGVGELAQARQLLSQADADPAAPWLKALIAFKSGDLHDYRKYIRVGFLGHDLAAPDLIDMNGTYAIANLRSPEVVRISDGPKVAILMPVRNVENYIDSAIASLRAQSWQNIEIVIVDDASTDLTVEIASKHALQDARVHLLQQSARGGPYVARNRAILQTDAEFVTVLDGDDWAHPHRIELQIKQLLASSKLIATDSTWIRVEDGGMLTARQFWPLLRWNPGSLLFRRQEVLDRAGLYDPVLSGADTEFNERLRLAFGASRIKRINEPLTMAAARSSSLTGDPKLGFGSGPANASRLAYWEAWHAWHLDCYMGGRIRDLRLGASRPFPAPEELLIDEC